MGSLRWNKGQKEAEGLSQIPSSSVRNKQLSLPMKKENIAEVASWYGD